MPEFLLNMDRVTKTFASFRLDVEPGVIYESEILV